ncbi:hypothetical protein BHMPCIPO_03599 [Ensifer sesbaniae]|nr:hypothetical protein [Ensifer sesbaniae]
MARMEIISGVERRRRWSKEAKLEILAEADQPGVRIGDVARRHDIYPAQIRLWRKTLSHFEASPGAGRAPGLLRVSPINPLQQIGHLTGGQRDRTILRRRPNEAAALEPLRIQR